jgi:hypothetical protein
MAWTTDNILPAIEAMKDSGLTVSQIANKLGKSFQVGLSDHLQTLVRGEKIRGPFKRGKAQYYYANGFGPSVEGASEKISALAKNAGVKLLSKSSLDKKITGFNAKFFADGLQHAISTGKLLKLICGGKSLYFLHRDVAADYFKYDASAGRDDGMSRAPTSDEPLTMAEVRPVYERLKSEQSGHGTVTIFALQKALKVPRQALHDFLLKQSHAGHVSLHPTSTVSYSQQVIDAGISLEGYASPVVNVVFKENV